MSNKILKDSIKKLFAIMNTLQNEYSEYNKKFTLDGRLVGDLGEIVCAEHYGIELFDKVEPIYDGVIKGTTNKVQIKTTFHESLTFPCNKKHIPEYYLGIKLYEDGFLKKYTMEKVKIFLMHYWLLNLQLVMVYFLYQSTN